MTARAIRARLGSIVSFSFSVAFVLMAWALGGCAHLGGAPCAARSYPLRADSTIELTIRSHLGEHTGHFLLDTGANVSALDPDWARLVAAPGGGADPEEAVLPSLRLGGVAIERPRFRIEPLASSYVGTLGTDILRRFTLTFDYRTGRVEIAPATGREAQRCTPDPSLYRPIPFSLLHGVPLIALRIGSLTIAALLDTGAWYEFVGMKQPLIEQLGERMHFVKNVYVISARGQVLQPSYMGLPVHIGPVQLHTPIVQDGANIVGLYVLRRFGRFTMDFGRNVLWIERAIESL
jgi:hypothetical protein